ncbi:glycosyl transferase family 90 [Helicobacter canis]|uniref:Lipopolysaccharide core biosynthesis protein LpsA n=1 Tax=Helicobacter canis TaxID=29419 RepID=A0A5M9QFN8_9HELI|nr:glycosyl transferase family 90 [Helicobacter canis]KAA8707623.1 lipopolysaccharide core biosynthesis protein LpsA [Helicobacter canis]
MGAKIIYNLKGIGRMLLPRAIPQALLESKLKSIFTLDARTLDSIAARVAHYHKLNAHFSPKPFALPSTKPVRDTIVPPHFGYLRDNKLSKDHSSVYFYDSYQWTRCFPDHFVWNYEFSDVNYYLASPAITKTRPIDSRVEVALESKASLDTDTCAPPQTNHTSILLQLEKHRHFSFIHDPIPYEKKRDLLFFRGACPQEHRSRFLRQYFSHPLCDLGHTGAPSEHPAYTKPKIPKKEHLHYKFLLSLEGNDVASNLKWILGSNSLCIMPKPRYESWFMEERLEANVHYALLNDDYGNLDSLLEFFTAHPKDAKEIIHNANAYCQAFQNPHIEEACNLLVLRKYFYLSDQGDLSPNERALLGL